MVDRPEGPVAAPRMRSETWRRIRVGLGGVASILLLLAVASAMLDRIAKQSPKPTAAVEGSSVNGVATPNEPMADLGVAPAAAEPTKTLPAAGAGVTK
jgi:hypothetical protein